MNQIKHTLLLPKELTLTIHALLSTKEIPENMTEPLILLTNDIYPPTIEENGQDHTCSSSTEGDEPECMRTRSQARNRNRRQQQLTTVIVELLGTSILDIYSETESDEFIKSSVENLVLIPSESEGIPDKMCDMPLCENTTPLNALNEHSEIVVNFDDDNSSSDDDSPYGEDIDLCSCNRTSDVVIVC
ncbi:hypothetical protein Tco_0410644 [Tanacetum coccineum]